MDEQSQIERVLAGDRQAFEPLVLRYQGPLFAYLQRLGLDPAETEDLAQEALVRAYRNLGRYDARRARFSTWLFTIARRLALNELGRAKRTRAGLPEAVVDPGPQPDDLDGAVMRVRLRRALMSLPPAERSLLALVYLGEFDLGQIALIEDCALGTVKSRLHRGRQHLRQLLEQPDGDGP